MGLFQPYWKKYRRPFLTGVICVFLEAVCDLLGPTITARVIDDGVAQGDMHYVLMMGGVMLGIAGVGAVFAMLRNIYAGRVSQSFGADLRFDLFCKIQSLTIQSTDELESASLITRLTNDVTQVMMFVNGMMRIFLKAPLTCIGSVIMAVILSPRLSLILILAVAVVFGLIMLSMRFSYPRFAGVQRAMDRLNRGVREFLVGIRLIKAFGREEREDEKFEIVNQDLADHSLRAARVLTVFTPLMSLVINLGIVVVLLVSGRALPAGTVEVGQVVALINYMTQILMSLMIVSNVFNMFVRMRASSERIEEVLAKTPEPAGGAQPSGDESCFAFEHVSFAYPGASSEQVLRDISFQLRPGETLAVIGPTGSGKSTLASLALRFYEPDTGRILLGGQDVRELDIKFLREQVSLAPQKSMLFSGTVAENIRWGNQDASDEQVQAAARASAAEEFIQSLPAGFDAMLGQNAVNLSGGQKQRLSIARALVKRPALLILDDCTSALDALTEARVRTALKEYSKDMMCILVTQRVSAAQSADKILVLDAGCAVGLGAHGELLERCNAYREICKSQLGSRKDSEEVGI